MQVLAALLFTMTTLLLLSNAVKASPVLPVGDDESSVQDLRELPAGQDKQFKRICGFSYYDCENRNGVKKNLLFIMIFVLF